MTRYKKYIQTKGYRLENDFPMMPYQAGHVSLLGVEVAVCENGVKILSHYDFGTLCDMIDRNGLIHGI